jgi:hypothetical protein
MLHHRSCGAGFFHRRRSAVTTIASNVHRFGPALTPRDERTPTAAHPTHTQAASTGWPYPEPVRPDIRWDEHAWWTKQLGHPLDDAA